MALELVYRLVPQVQEYLSKSASNALLFTARLVQLFLAALNAK